MSMEIYLLTDAAVPTTQAWQKAIDALGFDIRFVDEVSWKRTKSGCARNAKASLS